MALRDDGAVVGSVSGGCIEDDLIETYRGAGAKAQFWSGPPVLVRYGVNAADAHRFGLRCGDTQELLIETAPDLGVLIKLVHELDSGRLVRRSVSLIDGSTNVGIQDVPNALRLRKR